MKKIINLFYGIYFIGCILGVIILFILPTIAAGVGMFVFQFHNHPVPGMFLLLAAALFSWCVGLILTRFLSEENLLKEWISTFVGVNTVGFVGGIAFGGGFVLGYFAGDAVYSLTGVTELAIGSGMLIGILFLFFSLDRLVHWLTDLWEYLERKIENARSIACLNCFFVY